MWHHRFVQVGFCLVFFIGILISTPPTAHSQEPFVFQKGDFAIITAEDNPIELRNAPDGKGVADMVRVGAIVQIDDVAPGNPAHPYFVHSVTDRTRRGWVSGWLLKPVAGVRNHIGNVITCSEAATRGPICATTIPLTAADALMLHFDYYGVPKDAYWQWVITVGSEQYASRLFRVNRTEGASVLDLLDMEMIPHHFAGPWRITLYINGEKVHERGMVILAPPPTPTPTAIPTLLPLPTVTPTPRLWQSETIRFGD